MTLHLPVLFAAHHQPVASVPAPARRVDLYPRTDLTPDVIDTMPLLLVQAQIFFRFGYSRIYMLPDKGIIYGTAPHGEHCESLPRLDGPEIKVAVSRLLAIGLGQSYLACLEGPDPATITNSTRLRAMLTVLVAAHTLIR